MEQSSDPLKLNNYNKDPVRKMRAVIYHGAKDFRVEEVPVPLVTLPHDAVVKVTATTVCGSDLHLYHGLIPGMKKGDIVGHESVGIIEDVGAGVTKFKRGDRVVISAVISCGTCEFCKREEWSCCNVTNVNEV